MLSMCTSYFFFLMEALKESKVRVSLPCLSMNDILGFTVFAIFLETGFIIIHEESIA